MPGTQSIQGIISNLDTNSIIDTIIKSERQPATLLEKDKALKTQQVAAYQAIAAKFLALKTSVASLMRNGSFDLANINVSDDTVLSATADGQVKSGTYRMRVLSLATNHQLATQGFDSATTNILGTGTITISIGDKSPTTINIADGQNSLIGIKNAINNAHIGVTASIINDGTSSKAYRLLLTADKTGAKNKINISTALSGGENIDLTGSSFDNPEETSFSSSSTAGVTLGSTAVYTGNQNKTYTFTVAGNGVQTIGSDNIVLNWTDGTNSGSIVVNQADTEYELTGTGADGLKLTFSAGNLTAGDSFQVNTFAPLLQKAGDAQIAIGADNTDSGSPIIINSDTNTFEDVIPGIRVDIKKLSDPGSSITIKTDIDTTGIKNLITGFIDKYNDAMKFIDDQNTYNQDTKESGVLFSDFSLQVMQSSLRSAATSIVKGLDKQFNSLSSIGIRSDANGRLTVSDSSKLMSAIQENAEAFVKIFTDSGSTSSPYLEFVSAGSKTIAGEDYDVNITQAATHGYLQGMGINNPSGTPLTIDSSNNTLKFRIDGVVSNDIVLSSRTYNSGAELANELQTRINADSKIGNRGVTVEWVDLGSTGYLKLTASSYGSTSKVEIMTSITNTAFNILGLSQGLSRYGMDVAGTINGEPATGTGQILTGKEKNATTEGLKIKVTLGEHDLIDGSEGTISINKGIASSLDKVLDNMTKSIDGTIARRVTALNNQIADIDEQIKAIDDRLAKRREDLYTEYQNMETALQSYQSESSYLETQLNQISNNFKQMTSNNK
ncbi:hypothetical protein TRIP_C30013 [Candidatus Zixiibacteriota bacterium]|nr:hypothetical protein TRIP_C30013 [candidate division Zixibacteria bacterium]